MLATSLSTFSFFTDDAEAASIRAALVEEGVTSIVHSSPLYPVRRLPAIHTIHHGVPMGNPVATVEQLSLAERLGQRGLVDAYMYGGARSGFFKLSHQHICGQWLAAALAIAEHPNVTIEESEVQRAIGWVRDARARGDEWEIRNQSIKDAVSSIHRLNASTGANFQFAARLKA
jgi:hypothetical protein